MKAQYIALIMDTILKEIRSKTLIFIFVATTLSIFIANLVIGAVTKEMGGEQLFAMTGVDVLSLNFRIINSINFIVAAIFGVSVFRSDFENNIIYQYLSFPISRIEYFFVRVLGTWLLVLAYYAYSYLLSAILFSFSFKKIIFTAGHFYSFLILSVYLLLVIFISIFFSLLLNKIGALFATFVSCLAAAASYSHLSNIPYSEFATNVSGFKLAGIFVYFLFPRISFLDSISSNLLVGGIIKINLWDQIIHLLVISGLYVWLASYFVKKKDF